MRTLIKMWWLVLGANLLAAAALGQTLRMVPVPPPLKPQWTPVPENPKVFYAPNVSADVFRGPGGYYLYHGARWYHSRTLNGPWTLLHQVPEFLTALGPKAFKTPSPPAARAEVTPTKPVTPSLPQGTSPDSSAPPAVAGTATPLSQEEAPPAPAPEPTMIYDPGPP